MKEDLPSILDACLAETSQIYSSKQKSWFFGPFCSKPTSFYILAGDVKLIQKGIAKVNELIDEGENGIDFFRKEQFNKVKDRIPYERNMCDSVFGLVFGDVREFKKNEMQRNIEDHRTKLFGRAKTILERYETEEMMPIREFTMDSVELNINSDGVPQARVS